MASLATLINAVGDDLNRTDLTSQCSDAVVMAIRHYDSRRWWFNESSATFTATATSSYALPADFKGMDYVEARYSGGAWHELQSRDFPTIKTLLEYTSNGEPSIYAVHDQKIHLYQYPGGTDERLVRYYYTKSLATLTASASNMWTSTCQDLIRASAAKTVSLRKLHDTEQASMYASIESSEFNMLISQNELRVSTGQITVRY